MSKRKRSTKLPAVDSVADYRAAVAQTASERYELVLYIAGTTPQSSAAVETLSAMCDRYINGRYQLTVVDVYQEPARARLDQVIAVPTLIKRHPSPSRRFVGDLSDHGKLLNGLDLAVAAGNE